MKSKHLFIKFYRFIYIGYNQHRIFKFHLRFLQILIFIGELIISIKFV